MRNFSYADVEVEVHEGAFYPTETSKIIIDCLRNKSGYASKETLDLGCGSGVISTTLARLGIIKKFSASDISPQATKNAEANAKKFGLEAEIRTGSLYEPWEGRTFDLIICDVSGISESLARLSSWYSNGVPCVSGRDGTALVMKIIRDTPPHLNPSGTLVIPILTLSDHRKLVSEMEKTFKEVEMISSKQFYLPKEMNAHASLIDELNREGCIDVTSKFGLYLWETRLYEGRL